MKILFIAFPYMNLYKDIIKEMEKQGHRVTFFEDKSIKGDVKNLTFSKWFGLRKILWKNRIKRYWQNAISANEILSCEYDVLFVLTGYSIDSIIIDHLININPKIKTVFYTWDTCNYYTFEKFLPLFDKSYTFDIEDSKKDPRWILLPIYHKCKVPITRKSHKYDISIIGTNHDGRYSIVKRLLPQIKELGLKYYIRIVEIQSKVPLKLLMKYRLGLLSTYEEEEIKLLLGIERFEYLTRNIISYDEYEEVSNSSLCILDTHRDSQSGLTARFMWALACGKKIITTNPHALEYNFVNPSQVCVLGNDLQIPKEFLLKQLTQDMLSYVDQFSLENWVKIILDFGKSKESSRKS